MKQHYLCIIAILFTTINLWGQSKFGNVTKEELEMTSYPADTAASAIMLLKTGKTSFKYDLSSGARFETSIHTKIKILKTDGLMHCNQFVYYYDLGNLSQEKVSNLQATTYNLENGKIVKIKMAKENISDEGSGSQARLLKFTMPAAKVGSVIEFQYVLTSPFLSALRQFEFQTSMPVVETSYQITIPEYFVYHVNQSGYDPVEIKKPNSTYLFEYRDTDYDGRPTVKSLACKATDYSFSASGIPALKTEELLWNSNDYKTKVTFELQGIEMPGINTKSSIHTWEAVCEKLYEMDSFGDNLKKEGLFKSNFKRGETTVDRAREVLNFIRQKVAWNKEFRMRSTKLKDALNKGSGSSADINFLLINALKAAGFDVYPVVLSTRNKGFLPVHPTIEAFNYVIAAVKIDNELYYMDATNKYTDLDLLPRYCQVEQARIIYNNKYSEFINLSFMGRGINLVTGQYTGKDGQMTLNVNEVIRGNLAYDFKNFYSELKKHEEFVEKVASDYAGATIDDVLVEDFAKTGKDAKLMYTVTYPNLLESDVVYLNPLAHKMFEENPFKAETRVYPVNFDYLRDYTQIVTINIPEGYAIEELPKSEQLVFGENNDIIFKYVLIPNGNKIQFQYKYLLNKLIFLPEEYSELRNFYAKIVKKSAEQIVLKKINE